MSERTLTDLKQKQALPLEAKILLTKARVREWVNYYGEDGVYISFSGGKDSTVLFDLVRNEYGYKNIPAVFVDVPTQYPELRDFAKTFDNVVILKPKISFLQVCEKYGFPLITKEVSACIKESRNQMDKLTKTIPELADKDVDYIYNYCKSNNIPTLRKFDILVGKLPHKCQGEYTGEYSKMYDDSKYKFLATAPFRVSDECCKVMKKKPLKQYEHETHKVGMTAQMAEESQLRTTAWMRNGCNAFNAKCPISNPMSFWTEQDVLQYIYERELPICSVYGKVIQSDNQLTLADVGIDMGDFRPCYETTGCNRTGCMLCGFGAHLEKESRFQRLHKTHPKMYALLDKMTNNGYTMRQAIEWVNEHGNVNIRL